MKLKSFVVLLIPVLLFIAFMFYYPYKQVVAFTDQDQEKLLAYLSIKKDNTFQIKYTHSIHLSDVIESFHLSDKHIVLTELAYKDFAVGMPSNAEGEEIFKEKNGTYYIKNMNRSFKFIDLRIGQVRANHRVIYQDKTYTLSEYMKPGAWVRIKREKITLWQQLRGVNIND
ncbi:DUF1850 domain-containing protein [Metabacillus herbersteinensis]|uniref:DUF1850 domain-containing protein n=1 Tax=Metabacillus herbersteinensis TaxID=283816 RepID=A0ABV6GEC3_9BACI